MDKILTVAGSDCSGGAGVQADLKTILAHGAYGMSVVTSLTAQNTMGVTGIFDVPPEFVAAQLDAVYADIPPDAVKIGMLSQKDVVCVVAKKLSKEKTRHVVIDPVMLSTGGRELLSAEALGLAREMLYPLAELLTPNIPEAEILAQMQIKDADDMQRAAEALAREYGCAVLVKGGHRMDTADDVLFFKGKFYWYEGKRFANPNTHGTGCTLSSAAACQLAAGYAMPEAVGFAKDYLTGAILDGMDIGRGSGPLNHAYRFSS